MPKKFQRKTKKTWPMVDVVLSDVYGDDVLTLPSLSAFDMRTQRALAKGDVDALFAQLEEAGVNEATRDAIDDLQGDEVMALMREWEKKSGAIAGKSKS